MAVGQEVEGERCAQHASHACHTVKVTVLTSGEKCITINVIHLILLVLPTNTTAQEVNLNMI